MKLLVVLILIISTLFGTIPEAWSQTTTQDAVPAMVTETAEAVADAGADADLALTLPETDLSSRYDEMVYEDYDDGPFYAGVERLYDLAQEGQTQELLALYDQLYDQMEYLNTMSSLAYIKYCQDTSDDAWFDAYQTTDDQYTLCWDALGLAGNYITESDCADAFADHVGQDVYDFYADYEALTDREIELNDQELTLINEYYQLMDQRASQDFTICYDGRDWNWDMFYGDQGDELASSDPNAYIAIYTGLMQAETELIAPVYAQLVSIRREIASINGYDSYIDYAYEMLYDRDYTADDAQALCDAVKAISTAYYEQFYYNDMYYATDEVQPVMDTQTLLDTLAQYVVKVDASLSEPMDYMTSNGLYSIGDEAERMDGGYTTWLASSQSPFIYVCTYDDASDFLTISHEFGHYCHFYFYPQENLLSVSDLDLLEVHSNGLQALLTQWYDEIFTQGADVIEFVNLSDLMENVLDGCIQDEFQRRIYDCQEELTAETINRTYVEVYSEYNPYAQLQWNSTWLYVLHNFEAPLYYISYAASAMAALQLWDMTQTDPDAAAQTYLAILPAGDDGQSYSQVVTDCGLRLFSEQGAVADIVQPVMERMAQLDQTYHAGN